MVRYVQVSAWVAKVLSTPCGNILHRGVRQSSSAGCPYDNAVSESFFKHFKFEQVYPNYFPNYNSFKESIDEYVDFFNNKRPHHTLKNKIPSHYEEEYFSKIS